MKKTTTIGIIAAALVAGSASSPAKAVEPHEENAGIFTAQIPEEGSNIAWGQAVLVLDKPIEEVLPIVRDYANYVQFMPNFTKSKVLAQRGSRAMVYMEVSVAKGAITLRGQLNLAERPPEGESRVARSALDGRQHRCVRRALQAHPGRRRCPHRSRLQDLRGPRHSAAVIHLQSRERTGGRQDRSGASRASIRRADGIDLSPAGAWARPTLTGFGPMLRTRAARDFSLPELRFGPKRRLEFFSFWVL